VASSDTDFHRADVAPSWAHSFRRRPASRCDFHGFRATPARVGLPGMTDEFCNELPGL
jgi:hypothetical protein